jgi:biopolymer transport protein ExbD
MSHSAGGEGSTCEPNLTPMLDLVLQILMFFIVTVNFVTEERQLDLELPESQTARPLPSTGQKDPLFVNLRYNDQTKEYEVLVVGSPPMRQSDARRWIQKQYEDLRRFAGKDEEIRNPVIIRAHKEAEYTQFHKLLESCSDAGFRNLKIRAMIN